jgi:transposase
MENAVRRKYTAEFKEGAVKLVADQGYKISEAARNLGINATQLRRWVKGKLPDSTSASASMVQLQAELKPIDDRARQSERLSVRQQGKRIMRSDFRLELAACWSGRSRTGVFFSRTHGQRTNSNQKNSFQSYKASQLRHTLSLLSTLPMLTGHWMRINRDTCQFDIKWSINAMKRL